MDQYTFTEEQLQQKKDKAVYKRAYEISTHSGFLGEKEHELCLFSTTLFTQDCGTDGALSRAFRCLTLASLLRFIDDSCD